VAELPRRSQGEGAGKLTEALRWHLEYGGDAEQHRAANDKAWRTRTQPFADLAWIWSGFLELSNARRVDGMQGVPSGIAPSEVAAWLDLRDETDSERRRLFVDAVSALDAVYLERAERKRKERADHGR
jgi:hypothetical protein